MIGKHILLTIKTGGPVKLSEIMAKYINHQWWIRRWRHCVQMGGKSWQINRKHPLSIMVNHGKSTEINRNPPRISGGNIPVMLPEIINIWKKTFRPRPKPSRGVEGCDSGGFKSPKEFSATGVGSREPWPHHGVDWGLGPTVARNGDWMVI